MVLFNPSRAASVKSAAGPREVGVALSGSRRPAAAMTKDLVPTEFNTELQQAATVPYIDSDARGYYQPCSHFREAP